MSFYKKCPHCGANLDPGEPCDCQQEKEREERRREKLFFIENGGQMNFCILEEDRDHEKAFA